MLRGEMAAIWLAGSARWRVASGGAANAIAVSTEAGRDCSTSVVDGVAGTPASGEVHFWPAPDGATEPVAVRYPVETVDEYPDLTAGEYPGATGESAGKFGGTGADEAAGSERVWAGAAGGITPPAASSADAETARVLGIATIDSSSVLTVAETGAETGVAPSRARTRSDSGRKFVAAAATGSTGWVNGASESASAGCGRTTIGTDAIADVA
jgi:hypothetical protein